MYYYLRRMVSCSLVLVLLLSLFSGCAAAALPAPVGTTSGQSEAPLPSLAPFRVYYWELDPFLHSIIEPYAVKNPHCEATGFRNPNDMTEMIISDIENGTPPDLILLTRDTGLDIVRMAELGLLENFDSYLEQDSTYNPADYYTNVLDSGVINGGRTIMPLSFMVPVLISSQEAMEQNGIFLPEQPTLDELYQQIILNAEALKNDDTKCAATWIGLASANVMPTTLFLEAAGYDLATQGAEGLSSAAARAAIAFEAAIDKVGNSDKALPILRDYRTMRPFHSDFVANFSGDSFASTVLNATFSMCLLHAGDEVRFYDSVYQDIMGQTTRLIPMPIANHGDTGDPNAYQSLAMMAAVIPAGADSDAKQSAYEMVRMLMDSDTQAHLRGKYGVSVNRAVTARYMDSIAKATAAQTAGNMTIAPLSEAMKTQILDIFDKVAGTFFVRRGPQDIIGEQSHIYNKESMDRYEEFVAEVTILLTEYNDSMEYGKIIQ